MPMHKTILIHHDNVPNTIGIGKIKFDYTQSSEIPNLDTYISTEILPILKEYNLIFIKDNLSSSYLELYGLIVAYHIRLSETLGNTRYVPIVILGDIDASTLNKLVPMSNILFSKNIYLESNTVETIERYKRKMLSALSEEEYQTHFLNRISIEPPENSTNHNIANNWAIDRWARFVGAKESDSIEANSKKIEHMLYFKYLLALNPIVASKGIKHIPKATKGNGKILYIDDEWDKGWKDIFVSYFQTNQSIEFQTFEYDFTNKNVYTLQSDINTKVAEFYPDIVLLDLRLLSNDHTDTNRDDISKFSGVQIAKKIKEINPGIQIIMLTATGNSLILEELYKHGILGYIKKEHPEDIHLKTKDNIMKLAELVSLGFEKKYLKEIWEIQNNMLEILKKYTHNDDKIKEKYEKIQYEIDIMYEILDSNLENKLKFSLLTMFKVLELLTDIHYDTNNKGAHAKITFILKSIELSGGKTDITNDVSKLVCTRNGLIHSDNPRNECKDNIQKPLDTEYLIKWFKIIAECIPKLHTQKNNS